MTFVLLLLQFIGLVMKESSFQVEMSAYVHSTNALVHHSTQDTLTAIPILMFATVGLFLVLFVHHIWGAVGTVLAQSQVARHTVRSTMLVSWVLLPWAMVHFYTVTKKMAEAIQEKRPLTLFPDVYSLQVTAGYAQFGSFLAILLLVAPFLSVFFLRKATDLHNRRQQLSKTDCHLSSAGSHFSVTHLVVSVCGVSQIADFFYTALYLTVLPIVWVS